MIVWAVMLDEGSAGRTLISLWATKDLARDNCPSRDHVIEPWEVGQ